MKNMGKIGGLTSITPCDNVLATVHTCARFLPFSTFFALVFVVAPLIGAWQSAVEHTRLLLRTPMGDCILFWLMAFACGSEAGWPQFALARR
jgi:hypothetical protein